MILKRTRRILQGHPSECGAVCLGILLDFLGKSVSRAELRTACSVSFDGATVRQIQQGGERFGAEVTVFKKGITALKKASFPIILHWERNHFVVLDGFDLLGRAVINDPVFGRRRVSADTLSQGYSGVCLTVEKDANFYSSPGADIDLRPARWLREMRTFQSVSALFFLPAVVLATLFLFQGAAMVVFYDVSFEGELRSWSIAVVFVFLALSVILFGLELMGSRVRGADHAAFLAAFQIYFSEKLLSKKLQFIDSHFRGELMSRFRAGVDYVEILHRLHLELPASLFCVVILGSVLFFLSPLIAFVALLPGFLVMVVFVVDRRQQEQDRLDFESRSAYLDSFEGILRQESNILRGMGVHGNLINFIYQPLQQRYLAQVRLESKQTLVSSAQTVVAQLNLPAVVFSGIVEISFQRLSFGFVVFGVLLGAVAVKLMKAIVEIIARYQSLRPWASLLSEIVIEPQDHESENKAVQSSPGSGGEVPVGEIVSYAALFSFRNATFFYEGSDRPVFQGCELDLPARKIIGLTGYSGSGKSTFLDVLSGQKTLTSGSLFHNGTRVQGPIACGFCFAEDMFFLGSLALFFGGGVTVDQSRVLECISIVELESRLGFWVEDLSDRDIYTFSFSRGELQRLALAQAIYRSDDLLIIDEAFSHVSIEQASRIIERFREKNLSVILATQRSEILNLVDQQMVI